MSLPPYTPYYKRHVRQNVYGNWNGYLGRRRAIEFGMDEMLAKIWRDEPGRYDAILAESQHSRLTRTNQHETIPNPI